MIAPTYKKLAESPEYSGIMFLEIDVNDFDDEEVLQRNQIGGIPAFLTLLQGNEVGRLIGLNSQRLEELVAELAESPLKDHNIKAVSK
jgi:thiol-disulfide isomerase/thioredoxin